MYELINKQFIEVKEYNGQRVVTFKDIDTLHQRPAGTARRNFRANKQHFIEGVDYFKVKCSEVWTNFVQTPPNGYNPHADIILLTESGYLMIVKSFTDELAWKVQRQLINTYFRARQQTNYTDIDMTDIVIAIKELYEKNCELNDKISNLNKENHELKEQIKRLNKDNFEFTVIIRMICGRIFKKQSRKSKSKNIN